MRVQAQSIPCPVCNIISRGGDYEESLIKLVQTGIHLTDQRATDQSSVANLLGADVSSNGDDVNLTGASVTYNAASEACMSPASTNLSLIGADVSKNIYIPLMIAASHGHSTCIKLLIDTAADVNQEDRRSATALML